MLEQIASGVDSLTSAVGPKGKGKNEIEESPMVLPNFEQVVSDMAESIAARFVKRVAVTDRVVSYTIPTGGDKSVQMLIKVGAYEKALEKLDNVFAKSAVDNPDDLYNQGVCFEAVGDYGLAAVAYESALRIDPMNLTYAQGAGRIDRLKRENLRLKEQLSSKK
jgi:tetratricopeptide (TPR) repeat protein